MEDKKVRKRLSTEELQEWANQFQRRVDMRDADINKYYQCIRRKEVQLPPLVRNGSKGKELKERERKRVRRTKEQIAEDEKNGIKSPSRRSQRVKTEENRENISYMYVGTPLSNGNVLCGRCLEEKEPYEKSRSVCRRCYFLIQSYKQKGVASNKWNVRDMFINTKINHYEKQFSIGVRVDDRLQEYLTMIGYGFIFKEVYDK